MHVCSIGNISKLNNSQTGDIKVDGNFIFATYIIFKNEIDISSVMFVSM